VLSYILGDFFTYPSGHPAYIQVAMKIDWKIQCYQSGKQLFAKYSIIKNKIWILRNNYPTYLKDNPQPFLFSNHHSFAEPQKAR
jgi:hypothetical protein